MYLLGQCLALSFQQAVASLSTLQFAVHLAQRLPRWEDGFSLGSTSVQLMLPKTLKTAHTPAPEDIFPFERFCADGNLKY